MCKTQGGTTTCTLPDCSKSLACASTHSDQMVAPRSRKKTTSAAQPVKDEPVAASARTWDVWAEMQMLLVVAVVAATVHSCYFLMTQVLTKPDFDLNDSDNSYDTFMVVWCSGWITAVSTGLGAVPFYFIREVNESWMGVSNAIAAGMMISASCSLLIEAREQESDSILCTVAGALAGVAFIKLSSSCTGEMDIEGILDTKGSGMKRACLILAVMTLHSISEGVSIGVAYHSQQLGGFITTTLAIHNIPEGLALSIVLIPRGFSKVTTTLLCIFSSAPQPLMAVPAYIFVETFKHVVPVGLGFAAGCMLYVAIFELFAEARATLSTFSVAMTMAASGAFMNALQSAVSI